MPLRDAVVVIVPETPAREARRELDRLLQQQQRAQAQAQAAQNATRQVTPAQPVQVQRIQQARTRAQQEAAAERARADANARLQEALQALAKALSSSQCSTVGGTNGGTASISCPLENGGNGTISGGNGTTVTTPTPSPSPSTTPTPTPSPTASGNALTASSLPDEPVGPEGALSGSDLDAAVAQATAEWRAAGADVPDVSASVADLGGATLGSAGGSSIQVDSDAAGWGWSRMSLITVVRHEIGHLVGLGHEGGLMGSTLSPGESHGVDWTPPEPPAEEEAEAPAEEPAADHDHEAPAEQEQAPEAEPATEEPTGTTTESSATAAGDETATDAGVEATEQGTDATGAQPGAEVTATTTSAPASGQPPQPSPQGHRTWTVTDREADLDLDGGSTGTITYDAASGTLRVEDGSGASDLPVAGLVRIVIRSASGTVVVVGHIRLTSTGLVIAARDIVVTAGSSIDTTGPAGDGDIVLDARAEGAGANTSASASVLVNGATLRGGDITLSARSSTTGSAVGTSASVSGSSTARVHVLDSHLQSSGDISLLSDSRAVGSANATGVASHTSTTTDAANAVVLLSSRAETRLGGQSRVSADGRLDVVARNHTDARAASDASASGAGAGIATAAVDRTTRAVIDGASAWGIRVGRLGIDASSSGELWVDSSGNASGASSNTTAPITATLGAALTTGGPVRAASALGFGRVDSLTEAILSSSGGEVLTLTTATDARVNAWSSDHSGVSADAAAAALGTAVAVVFPTLGARASLDGSVVVDGGVLSLGADLTDDSSASAVGGRQGALAAAVGRRSSSAGLGEGASLTGTLDELQATARSTTAEAGAATATGPASESLAVVVADSATLAGLANGATVGGVENLTVTATGTDTTTATAGTSRGQAVVLTTVTTGARLGTGTALVLAGDLALTAEQSATARATAPLVALTLATHDVSATIGRAVTAGGSLSARATGSSTSFASTPSAAPGAVAGTTLAEVLLVRGVADALATASGARGSSPLPGLAPAPMTLGSVAVTVVRGSAVVELPALPIRAGGPVDLVAISGGSGAAGTGAPRDGGATGGPAVSIVLAILPSKVRVPGPVQTDEDLLLQAGRGPPAQEQTTAPLDPTSIRIIHRPSTVEIIGPVTLTGPGSTLTVLQDTTAPVEAIGLPQQVPPQAQQAPPPPAGAVFVSAATGGTVTAGRATLTFAPGSLPTDAWVVIHLDRRAVRGLLATSVVYDLLAFDARNGAAITTFRAAPVLTIAVDGATASQRIYYLAPDGSLEVMPTVTGVGTVTAALPHFSPFAAGSPLDGLVGAIVPVLQQYLADALSGPRTETLDDLDLGVLVIESPTISFTGFDVATAPFTVSVTVSGLVRIDLVVGSRRVAGTATLSGTYAVANEALDAGDFSLTLADLSLTVADVLTLTAASAEFAQDGDDVTITASAATATLAAPGGPALTVTATDLDLLIQDDGDVAFRLAGATAALTGIPQVSASGTGWTLAYNGTGALVTLGGVDLAAAVDIEATGAASITAAGQSLTATTLTVTRAGQALSLAATRRRPRARGRRNHGGHRLGRLRDARRRRHGGRWDVHRPGLGQRAGAGVAERSRRLGRGQHPPDRRCRPPGRAVRASGRGLARRSPSAPSVSSKDRSPSSARPARAEPPSSSWPSRASRRPPVPPSCSPTAPACSSARAPASPASSPAPWARGPAPASPSTPTPCCGSTRPAAAWSSRWSSTAGPSP